ncbi:hypothetical protein MMC30_008761 [Trapelia coarctata]|nr:hypothetical protein [Trapelia coarctata]
MTTDYKQLAAQLESLAANPPAALFDDEPTRRRLLAAVQNVIPEIEKPQDTIQRLMYTPLELVAARIGCNLNLFETLEAAKGPVSTAELAKGANGDLVTLDRLFKYMASLSLIKEVGVSMWAPSRLTKTLAQKGVAAGVFHNFDNTGPTMLALPQWLHDRKYSINRDIMDTAFSHSHDGKSAFQWLGENPVNMQNLGMWMTVQRYGDEFWLDLFPFEKVVTEGVTDTSRPLFVDVGGGVGHQCQALIAKYPNMAGRVVLEDQPQVIENALAVDGMEKRGIDFFVDQPVKGARAYYLRNILHDWPDDRCLTILSHIKGAMGPDSLLLVDEMVIPSRNAHKIAMQVDLTMLSNLASEERSEQRWHDLLGKAGFKIDHIYTYQAEVADSVIVASATA